VRRGAIVRLVVLGIVLGLGATAVAILIPWLPDSASDQAEEIDFVFWFVTAICIVIFSVVASVAVYSVLKFRAPPDDDSDGLPIHGHTGIEIVWTVGPFVLVTAMAIVSAVALARNQKVPDNAMVVNVVARQFAWQFLYPPANAPDPGKDALECDNEAVRARCVTSAQLHLPVDVPIHLRMRADDVGHSFWVPEFRQKQDLLPGMVTTLVITPTKVGDYEVLCTELCGLGHSTMRSAAIVSTRADFDKWKQEAGKQTSGGGGNAGEAVFTQNGCGSCHTLKEANATGTVGPNLDELPAAAQRAGKPLEAFVRESIVDPDAYVAPGFPKGVMPKTFANLPKEQLDALVQYLVKSSEGGGSR
jgi:cytochrome c oxidase subunit II